MTVNLNDVRSLSDPLRQYNHDLVLPNIPGGGNGAAVRIHLVNTNIPGVTFETFESNHHGFTFKHVGRRTFPRTLITEYEESSDLTISKMLNAWRQIQWEDGTGIQAPSSVYKTNAFLQLIDHEKNITGTIKLLGVFIEDIADSPLDGATSDAVRLSVTYSYDSWELET